MQLPAEEFAGTCVSLLNCGPQGAVARSIQPDSQPHRLDLGPSGVYESWKDVAGR